MTLVGSGTLNLKGSSGDPTRSIEYECEGGVSGTFTLLTAQGIASGYVGTLPTGMTDFYGYSAGSTIVYDYSDSITWTTNQTGNKDGYQSLVFSGRQSGDVVTLNVNIDFVETSGSVICVVYYSINSTSSWTTLQAFSATDDVDRTIPGVDYNDVVRIRIDISNIKSGEGWVTVWLEGGFFTSGSGSITTVGSDSWYVEIQ